MPNRSRRFSLAAIDSYRHIGDAQIHPDGSCVAFVAGDLTHPRGKNPRSNIWLAASVGNSTRAFTSADACEVHPRWSPDGKTLAFLSDRAKFDVFHIYLMSRDGGEAEQITFGDGIHPPYREISMFEWSPDGTKIAFLLRDAIDPQRARYRAAGYDQIEFEANPRFTRIWIVDVATRHARVVTRGDVQVWEFSWSPDSQALVMVCSAEPFEWSWYKPWLATVPASGGKPKKIYSRHKKQLAQPRWSPDGHHIAFTSSLWSDRGIVSGDVYLTSARGKQTRRLSENYPGSVGGMEWLDHNRLLTIGYLENEAAITRFDIEGAHERVWRGEGAMQESYSPRFSRAYDGTLAVIRSAPNLPREVWILNADDNHSLGEAALVWEQLTNLNDSFAKMALGSHEIVEWAGADGAPMQGVLVRAANAKDGKRLPLIVHPHGGPTGISANDFSSPTRWVYHLTTRGFAVFMPNYRGSTGKGIEFAEANIGDMGGKDFQDIMLGVDALIQRGIADSQRMGFGGWSYGGYLTAWAITQTNRFKAAVAGAAITNWTSFHGTSYLSAWDELHYEANPYEHNGKYDKFSPMRHIEKAKTPTLILHGQKDGDVPVSQGHELYRALKERGIDTELVIYPREPHAVTETPHVKDLITRVCDWFVKYV